jgi:hypothetical protein
MEATHYALGLLANEILYSVSPEPLASSMSFNEMQTIKKSRKIHECVWCSSEIYIGESHQKFVGIWEGDFQNWRIHHDCLKVLLEDRAHKDSGEICQGPHGRGEVCKC